MHLESNNKVEFLYKKSLYIFPEKAKIFLNGNKLLVEFPNKKITNISMYLSNTNIKRPYNCTLGFPITDIGSQLEKDYQAIVEYFDKNPKLDFLSFEYATSHELALCTFFKSMDLVNASNLMQDLRKEMPYLVNIFRRPLIHLKEIDVIQPTDTVKRVNHNTMKYLSRHAETWKNIEDSAIIPAKLLTRVYDDDYSIYENIVFRDLIDKSLTFLRKRIYYLTELFDIFNDSIQLDAITRFNHQNYYLAMGKLYVGFSKMKDSSELLAMLENAKYLYKQLNTYKTRAVYTKNANIKPINSEIKRTNILGMHKDYKHVYSLYQKFNKQAFESQAFGTFLMQDKSQSSYELFCQMLVLFAASNFNLSCKSNDTIYENKKLNACFKYKDWSLHVYNQYNAVLNFDTIIIDVTHNNKSIKFLIIPMSYYIAQDKKMHYEHIIKTLYYGGNIYDKYVFLEPFDLDKNSLSNYSLKCSIADVNLYYAVLPVSISEINSFRRIQKLLFECMVRTNNNYDICAFCGENLVKANNTYLCCKCRTAVKNVTCEHCQKNFTATYIDIKNKNKNRKKATEEDFSKDLPDFYKQEKQYLFRDIVNINENNFVCPHCGGGNKI